MNQPKQLRRRPHPQIGSTRAMQILPNHPDTSAFEPVESENGLAGQLFLLYQIVCKLIWKHSLVGKNQRALMEQWLF